jgi:hypothetical protein
MEDINDSIRVNTEEITGMDMDEEAEVLPHLSRKRKTDSRSREPSPGRLTTLRPARVRKPTYKAAHNSQNEADTALYTPSPPHA